MTYTRAIAPVVLLGSLPILLGGMPPEDCSGRGGQPGTVIERIVRGETPAEIKATMGYRFRYRVRTDQPIRRLGFREVTVVSDFHDLPHGSRWLFWFPVGHTDDYSIYRTDPIRIGRCHVGSIPTPKPPARGCGHCNAASPGSLGLWLVLLLLVMRRRTERPRT